MKRVILIAALVGLASPGAAHAYSSHEDFANPIVPLEPPPDGSVPPDGGVPIANAGGGDGRYFTGSFEDGYTCAVCHVGGETPPDAAFEGLPPDGYRPGETYRLTLTLPDAARSAGAVEITDAAGRGVGQVALLPEAELAAADECNDPLETAAFRTELPERRVVTNVDACGASQLRLDWTAPDENVGAVWVHAVAVGGNGDGRSTPPPDLPEETDDVFAYATLLPYFGERPETTRVTTCAAAPSGDRGGSATIWLLLAVSGLALRRRRGRPAPAPPRTSRRSRRT